VYGGKRVGTAVALVAAVVVAAIVLWPRDTYEVRAQFYNSGQLVEGGEVQVAGRTVGSITEIELTDDDLAEVTFEVTDDDLVPLHEGTRVQIRAVGPAGIANRFINLLPGSRSAKELPDGAVIGPDQTHGIVELDALLGMFDEDVRDDFEQFVTQSAVAFAGSGAGSWNSMLAKLDPALGGVQGMFEDLASDNARLERLIRSGEKAASAVASRSSDLTDAVATSAEWLASVAGQRDELAGALENAPAAINAGRRTLAKAQRAVDELRPTLPELTASAKPLAGLLEGAAETLPKARPVVRDLRKQLPSIDRALARMTTLEKPLTAAFKELGPAFKEMTPILEGFRLYSVDFALGVVNGLAGIIGGNFNSQGHYFHANFAQSPQTLITSPVSDILGARDLLPGVFGARLNQTATCPGGLVPPAPDGSSPIHDRPDLCDPEDSLPASVNEPPELGG